MPSHPDETLRALRRVRLDRMFVELRIDKPTSAGINRAAILTMVNYLLGNDVSDFHAIGAVRRSGATPHQLNKLTNKVEELIADDMSLEQVVDSALSSIRGLERRVRMANNVEMPLGQFGAASLVSAYGQAPDSLAAYFDREGVNPLGLGVAVMRERRPASLLLAVRDAGVYHWYLKTVLSADEQALREFEIGVVDGLQQLDLGSTKLTDVQCSHLLDTLLAVSAANERSTDAFPSPATELILKILLSEYSHGDDLLREKWNAELRSATELLLHYFEDDLLAVNVALSTELKPALVVDAQG